MDTLISVFLNNLGKETIFDLISYYFSHILVMLIILITLITLVYYFDKKNLKKIVIIILIGLTLYFVISDGIVRGVLKDTYYRPRPYLANSEITGLEHKTTTSFPSGHMTVTFTILTIFIYYYRKYWPYALVFAILMALSRIHNGMHYPSDTIAGAALGIIIGLISIKIRKLSSKLRFNC